MYAENKFTIKQTITSIVLGMFLLTQVFSLSVFLMPKQAEAADFGSVLSGLGSAVKQAFSVPEWNWYEVLKDLAVGALRAAANRASERFLADFVNKMNEKYKIRNFLYYDKVLSDYYLNRYLYDKISDPNLRQIYGLMEKAFVSGKPTGTSNAPDPRRALIPQLKKAISNYYIDEVGGIDPKKIYEPGAFKTDREYFKAGYAYFSNPISFTERNLQGNYGEFQSSASTAAQLEVLVGNGLKAGRFIGGTCSKQISNPTPESCKAAGGVWQASAIDEARSFIDNPTRFIDSHLMSAIQTKMDKDWDPNNFWVVIGSALGNFLIDQFSLKKNGGSSTPLPDGGSSYNPLSDDEDYSEDPMQGIDTDGDGTPEGYDYDGDGQIDTCTFGGTPPDGCMSSSDALGTGTEGGFEPPPDAQTRHPDRTALINSIIEQLRAAGVDLTGDCPGKFTVVQYVAWELKGEGAGYMRKESGNNCQGYSTDRLLFSDGYLYDIVSDGPTGQWIPNGCPNSSVCPELWVAPVNPYPTCDTTDPLFNLMDVLNEISDGVSGWNLNERKVSAIGITKEQLEGFNSGLDDVEGDSAARPYGSQINDIQSSISGLLVLFRFGFLQDPDHRLTNEESSTLTAYVNSLQSKVNDLTRDVGIACNQ